MARTFDLQILTPEYEFFNGQATSVSVKSIDGFLTVWAGHSPMASALDVGQLTIRTADETLIAFHSKGFMEVLNNTVTILSQACEWPDEIDESRAESAEERAAKRLASEGFERASGNRAALTRARARLEVFRRAHKKKEYKK